ncbi:MAG: fasciclin domain-containing protein [Imperialibacter sp.]
MKNYLKRTMITTVALMALGSTVNAQNTVQVGGGAMYPKKDIVDNAVNSADHTTLVAAVKAAGLVATLKGDGPFTVFAPTNAAFDKLPEGTVAALLKPENKDQLTKVLTYHVIAGKYDSKSLQKAIKSGNGMAKLKTVSGGMLTFMLNGPMNIVMKDESGNVATISTYDVYQSNGVINVIESVLLPL